MDIILNYNKVYNLYQELGQDKFFEYFRNKYESLKLYTFGFDWLKGKNYILKFKGTQGDLIINWG